MISDKPPAWTRRARRSGKIALVLLAGIVGFAYWWTSNSWPLLIFFDSVELVAPNAKLDGVWVLIGLVSLAAIPVYVVDRVAGWQRRRARRRRR